MIGNLSGAYLNLFHCVPLPIPIYLTNRNPDVGCEESQRGESTSTPHHIGQPHHPLAIGHQTPVAEPPGGSQSSFRRRGPRRRFEGLNRLNQSNAVLSQAALVVRSVRDVFSPSLDQGLADTFLFQEANYELLQDRYAIQSKFEAIVSFHLPTPFILRVLR